MQITAKVKEKKDPNCFRHAAEWSLFIEIKLSCTVEFLGQYLCLLYSIFLVLKENIPKIYHNFGNSLLLLGKSSTYYFKKETDFIDRRREREMGEGGT